MPSVPGVAVIIPARLESTRLPRKLLQEIAGRSVLEWTWSRACAAEGLQGVWIATDSDAIAEAAATFGAAVLRTGPHVSGSDRVGDALSQITPAPGWVINLQGDEPLLDPRTLERVADALRSGPDEIVTCGAPCEGVADWLDPSVVKVVLSSDGRALYFSRAPVPGAPEQETAAAFARVRAHVLRHVGLYGFPVPLLRRFLSLSPTALEQAESLEQHRLLEAGLPVRVLRLEDAPPAVDTAEDLRRVRTLLADWASGRRCDPGPPVVDRLRSSERRNRE